MKIKTSELTGAALNWAVAECRGFEGLDEDQWLLREGIADMPLHAYTPSTDWSQGGPIIEREQIDVAYTVDGWYANMYWRGQDSTPGTGDSFRCGGDGPTPLIAAMRCYVASELGDEVEVPEELCSA